MFKFIFNALLWFLFVTGVYAGILFVLKHILIPYTLWLWGMM